jgi:hypothetical protein
MTQSAKLGLAAVSLKNYMESLRHINMPGISWSNVVVTAEVRPPDNDLGELLNLLWDMPQVWLAYPEVRFSADAEVARPRVLVIGDSYYWNLVQGGYVKHLFSNEQFWYYNSSVFRNGAKIPLRVKGDDLLKTLESQDFVMIMNTDACLGSLGNGFISQALNVLARNHGVRSGRLDEAEYDNRRGELP